MIAAPIPPNEDERLAALRGLCILDTACEERFDRITELAARMFDVPIALVSLVDAGRLWFKSRRGLSLTEIPRDRSFCGHAILGDGPFVVRDTARDDRFRKNPLVTHRPRVRFYAGHPLKAADGSAVGTLCIIDRRPRRLSDADVRALGALAALVETELTRVAVPDLQREIRRREAEVARLDERLEARAARLRTLARVNQLVSSSLDMNDILQEIASAAARLMDAPFASFWLADEDSQTLELGAWVGDVTVTDAPVRTLKFSEGAVGWVARHRRPLHMADVAADERFVAREWAEARGLRSVLAVPVTGEGALLAVLALVARAPFSTEAEDQNLVEIFAAQAAAAIRNARIYAESEARRRAAEALADVGAVLAQTLDPEVVGQRVADSLRVLLGAHSAALFRLEPGSGNLVTMAVSGATDEGWDRNLVFPRGSGATGLAIEDRRPVVSPNVLTDPRIVLADEFRARIEASQHRAVVAVPLVIKDRAIGALSVGDRAGRLFREDEVRLAQACADQAALALEGARLFQDAQDRGRVTQALYDLTVAMDRTMDVRERVEIFLEKAREALDFDRVGVFLATPDTRELEMIAGTDLDPATVPPVAFWERGGGFQAVWETGETVVVSTDAELAALPPAPPEVREHPFSRSRRFVIVPLRFQGRPIGAVGADNKPSRRPFSPQAVARLELFSQQLAISVNTARVFAESEGRRRAAEALADVGAVLAQTLDPEVVAQRIADDIRALLAASTSAVYRLDPESGNLVAVAVSGNVGPTFGRNVVFPRGTGVAAIAVREGQPVMTADILNDPRILLTPEVRSRVEQAEYRAVLALPLLVKDKAIGALGVGDRLGRRFRRGEIDLAQAFAHQAALALQSAELFQDVQDLYAETQRREREATVLFEVVRRLSTTLDLEQILDIIAEHTLQVLPCDAAGIYRWDEARGGLAFVRGRNMNPDVSRDVLLKPGEGVGGRAYADRRPVWSNDRLTDPALVYSAATAATLRRALTPRAYLAVPIVVRNTVFGVLIALHREPQQYSTREIDLLSNLAAQAAVAIENASLFAAEATARASAEAATGAKSRFLASMSHELRTPLNSVIGFANVLLKNRAQNLREQDLVYLGRILDNGKHLLGLINDILDLSKVEAGRIDLTLGTVALDGLVNETIRELESQLREGDVRLLADLPPSMAQIQTDRSRLKQVLINLIGNALKFTERGSVTVRVAVEPDGHRPVCIDVIDTGIGIPREKQGLIFEAFQQSDTSTARRYGGTGLGLAISRSLAQQLGYQLAVESEVGQGSTFRILLSPSQAPARGAADVSVPSPRPAAQEAPRAAALDGRVVLVVDDESDSRILLAQVIEDLGCTVLAAGSGEEGVRMAKARRPDLIVLDLIMPGMSGWRTLAALKADPELHDIPVVIVSIIASENRSTMSGPVDFLDKPVTRENLLEVLARHFPPRRA